MTKPHIYKRDGYWTVDAGRPSMWTDFRTACKYAKAVTG